MERTICCFAKNLTILSIIASLCLFPFETCYGGRASTSLGSTQGVNDNPPYPPPAEILLDNSTARFIATLAVFRSYEKVNQWYGANTTWNNIYLAANASGQQYGIAFYIGHGNYSTDSYGYKHYYIYDNAGTLVHDWGIIYYTNRTAVRFVILWACFQGEVIGGMSPNGQIYGMPYAWLHTTNLSHDGYGSPDGTNLTFIGWQEEAPFLMDTIQDNGVNAQNASYYFLLNFYNSALYYQKTIKQSLDDASAAVWGDSSYANTWFHRGFWYYEQPYNPYNETGWLNMTVYGDGGQRLR